MSDLVHGVEVSYRSLVWVTTKLSVVGFSVFMHLLTTAEANVINVLATIAMALMLVAVIFGLHAGWVGWSYYRKGYPPYAAAWRLTRLASDQATFLCAGGGLLLVAAGCRVVSFLTH